MYHRLIDENEKGCTSKTDYVFQKEHCAKISYMTTILLFMEDIEDTTKQTH